MSGGAFDYKDNILFELQDLIAREIGLYEYGCTDSSYKPKDPRTIEYMKMICGNLSKLANVLHSLDWYLSGDTGEDEFISEFESYLNTKEDK